MLNYSVAELRLKIHGMKRWKNYPIIISLVQENNINCRIMLFSLYMHELCLTKRGNLP